MKTVQRHLVLVASSGSPSTPQQDAAPASERRPVRRQQPRPLCTDLGEAHAWVFHGFVDPPWRQPMTDRDLTWRCPSCGAFGWGRSAARGVQVHRKPFRDPIPTKPTVTAAPKEGRGDGREEVPEE